MSGFAPGDVVVCVDADSEPLVNACDWESSFLVDGRAYTIAEVWEFPEGDFGVTLEGDPADLDPANDNSAWEAWRFRKINPASDEFTEQMRALRPHKVGEPA